MPYWQFVSPSFPMAAHPDQVWLNGVAQTQVASLSQLRAGTFFLDEATSQLHIGSDPTGRTVEASTLSKAVSVRANGVVIRGIGIRRYAPSVWMVGAVTLEAPSARVENVVVQDMATTGISALATDITLNRVSVLDSGMLGIHARFADRLQLTSVLSSRNNDERFNIAPVSGGAKIGATRGVTVRNSSFSGNFGHGFWIDLSVYNTTYANTTFRDNVGTGLFLEISARATVVDSLFSGNGEFGIKVNNTSDVKIWNNTFVGNGRPLNIVQDSRRNTNPNDAAVDPRVPWPDPAMPWTLGPVTMANNVVGNARPSANCLLCVEDYSHQKTAAQMGITANSNVYHRPTSSQPTWLAVWSRGPGDPAVYTTLAAFKSATGQEAPGAGVHRRSDRRRRRPAHHGGDLARRHRGLAVASRRRRRGWSRRRRAAARLLALRSASRPATGPRRGQRPADQGGKKIRRIELHLRGRALTCHPLGGRDTWFERTVCKESEKCGRKIQRRATGCRVTRKRSRRGRPTSSRWNLGLASSPRPVARTATRAA